MANAESITADQILNSSDLATSSADEFQWRADGREVGFLSRTTSQGNQGAEFWVLEAKTGKRRSLLSAKQLAAICPKSQHSTAIAETRWKRAIRRYFWAPDGNAILFVGDTWLSWFDLRTGAGRNLIFGNESITDPKISPDIAWISFVKAHTLYLLSLQTGAVSTASKPGSAALLEGELDPTYMRDFKLTTGYWWAPDGSAITYIETDESLVPTHPTIDSLLGRSDEGSHAYIRVEDPHPSIRLFVCYVRSGDCSRAINIEDENDVYLPRIAWLPDSRHIAIERLNRWQNRLDLLIADARTGVARVVLTEEDRYWINIDDGLRFLRDGKRFIWSNERSGYRHLYLYRLDGAMLAQLTHGTWEVTRIAALDENENCVYFTASKETPTDRQIYRVNLDGSGFKRITTQSGWHNPEFAPDARTFVDTYSNALIPPRHDLIDADGTQIANVTPSAQTTQYALLPVEFLKIETHDGATMDAMIIKPASLDINRRYPVIVFINGGPGEQAVRNAWGGPIFLWHEMMAQKGFVVFAVDNRGAGGHGHVFEEPIHYQFGAQDLSDQRDGIAYLRQLPFVDCSRVGVWGSGFSGQIALHAMLHDSADFTASYVESPITDWRFYSPIFTERYLGPLHGAQGEYLQSSPIEAASRLKGKLLVAARSDESLVYITNMLRFEEALSQSGNYSEFAVLGGEDAASAETAALHFLVTRVTSFFTATLGSQK